MNGLQIETIKCVIALLVPILTRTFNLVFNAGTFPEIMPTAKVLILHKGGDINNLSRYGPISILPILFK